MEAKGGQRMGIGALAVSAALVASIAGYEGYRERAYIPVPGDKPTVGHGTTVHPDGKPVKLGDTVTPSRAMDYLRNDTDRFAVAVKRCIKAPLHQAEFDTMVDFAYQYGAGALCGGSIAKLANDGDYVGSCKAYANYRFIKSNKPIAGWEEYRPGKWRFDCSTPGNKICYGVWARQEKRIKLCMGQ